MRGARRGVAELVEEVGGAGEGAGGREGGAPTSKLTPWLLFRLRGGVAQAFAFSFTLPSAESPPLLRSLAGKSFKVGLRLAGLGLFLPADFAFFLMQGKE